MNQPLLLDDNYWSERYYNQQTSWDMQQVSPPIKAYFDQFTDKNAAILIPGCGNAYEAEYLLQQGFTNITLVDISAVLVTALQQKLADYPYQVKVLHQDFFTMHGSFDVIVEQTFFCAIDPSLRAAYVAKMKSLLRPNGMLIGLLFNRSFEGGPPFGGNVVTYKQQFENVFSFVQMEPCYNSIKPRSGSELFIICKP
ncbi:methyltransferase domain-containing protein [Ferruginibacter yonginensis]|uniref:Methyltransferase domain-containing protein n=1 Tax=Ferruginibacter yonginensis TaxID=1310416 RepID=A0ABV8QQ31_9BACT